ncbi:prenyltransferase/squalene oxidase repeat-containing protein [Cupriavidus sp. TMH.W2]|uniref:prenyltransferase/squalene oxidase repeat-containing protein n=1 Tax=Cupriavidus sp. TMH.W2 TaxID=3434465 RepID=UPI003D774FC6
MSDSEWWDQVVQPATAYLTARQSPGGGFCFYRGPYLDEPNLADTYCAIRALRLLGQAVPHKARTLAFLHAFDGFDQPAQLHARAMGLLSLAPGWRPDSRLLASIHALRIAPAPAAGAAELHGWLSRTRPIARLKHAFDGITEAPTVRAWIVAAGRDGGYGERPNLWDTWLALDIAYCCGARVDRQASLAFVDRLQVPPYGFTAVKGSVLGNLEMVFAGVRCCALLGVPVRFAAQARSFVCACQTGKGGFARSPGALPNIELTYRALWILDRLRRDVALRAPSACQDRFQ